MLTQKTFRISVDELRMSDTAPVDWGAFHGLRTIATKNASGMPQDTRHLRVMYLFKLIFPFNKSSADTLGHLSAQAEKAPRSEVASGVRSWCRAARLRQRLQGLVGGEHAVHGKAIEDSLDLRQLLHRPEGLEGLGLGTVKVILVAVVVRVALSMSSTTTSRYLDGVRVSGSCVIGFAHGGCWRPFGGTASLRRGRYLNGGSSWERRPLDSTRE